MELVICWVITPGASTTSTDCRATSALSETPPGALKFLAVPMQRIATLAARSSCIYSCHRVAESGVKVSWDLDAGMKTVSS